MGERPYHILANKMDLPDADENLKKFKRKVRRDVIPISAEDGEGIQALKALLKAEVQRV